MSGIRIRAKNPSFANARVAFTHPTKKLKARFGPDGKRVGCFACGGMVHTRKTVHIDFDANGDGFVSAETLQLLRETSLESLGLSIENEVAEPPEQFVSMAGGPVAVTNFQEESRARFPRLEVIKNRILRPSVQAEKE